jgi:hypothetical protein
VNKGLCIISLAAALLIPVSFRAQENPDRVTVTWSDPSRPGLLKVNVFNGGVSVRTHNRPDVIIESKPAAAENPAGRGARGQARGERVARGARGGRGERQGRAEAEAAAAGLKRIGGTTAGGLSVDESNNVISLSSSPFNPSCCMNYEIFVPVRTNLNLTTMAGAVLSVEGVEGEIEVTNMNGALNLTNVAGSVVANSMNGKVTATLRQTAADKMMSFASMNGDVDVTLPANAKANLQMRTNGGEIFSDFDVQLRPATRNAPQDNRKQGGAFHVDFDSITNGVINGGGPNVELRTFQGNIYIRKGK